MNLNLKGKNLYIFNKKPQRAEVLKSEGTSFKILGEQGNVLDGGEIDLKNDLHACLYCKLLKNIVFIVKKEKAYHTSLLLADEIQFESVLEMIRAAEPEVQFSEQNAKINGYAASVVDKLQEGVKITIIETKEEKVKCCPVCGMECDPNIPYCMECGAPV